LYIYSEPHSILAAEAPPIPREELEKMIRERMGEQDKSGIDASKIQQNDRYGRHRTHHILIFSSNITKKIFLC
jgi:hypothetical protein